MPSWLVLFALVLLFAARAFVYWWDCVRGGEAALLPPAAVVAAPLRRLFVLQFVVLVLGLVSYWALDSSTASLVLLVLVATVANVLLAVSERLRTSRVRAALAAGVKPPPRPAAPAPAGRAAGAQRRGGRKRGRRP